MACRGQERPTGYPRHRAAHMVRRRDECPGLGELGGVPAQAVGASFWTRCQRRATRGQAAGEPARLARGMRNHDGSKRRTTPRPVAPTPRAGPEKPDFPSLRAISWQSASVRLRWNLKPARPLFRQRRARGNGNAHPAATLDRVPPPTKSVHGGSGAAAAMVVIRWPVRGCGNVISVARSASGHIAGNGAA